MIGEVFRETHASLTGGQFGLTKTLGRIRLKYYWVGMAAHLRYGSAMSAQEGSAQARHYEPRFNRG